MDNNKITQFLAEIEKIERQGSANSRSRIFAHRAHEAIVSAYETVFDAEWHKTGEYKPRNVDAASIEKADTLIEMGATEAVYGRGRFLLRY